MCILYISGDLICNTGEMHLCLHTLCEHLCGLELVVRCPGSGLLCVVLHGRVSGEVLVNTVNIRGLVTWKLICELEWRAGKPDARFSFSF